MAKSKLNDRILCVSDLHIPYHHPDSIAFLKGLKKKYDPTRVIFGGDEIDHHAMSFHDSDPDLPAAGDELMKAIGCLQPLYKLFPKVDLLESNHGSMVYRKGKHHGIPRKYLRTYGEVLGAPRGWKWHEDLILDLPGGNQCYFHHGLVKDVYKVVAMRGMCVVQFHFHTEFRITYLGNPNSLLWGVSSGCLIDRKALAFAYDNLNLGRPIIGCSILIDGQPKLLPMILNKQHRWTGFIP